VINAAAGGYSTIESLGYLQTRLVYYKPDVVILMHGWNDMYYFTLSDYEISKWRNNFNLEVMWNPNVSGKMSDPMPKDIQYLSWSQFYLHLREWIRHSNFFSRESQTIIEKRFNVVKTGNKYKIMLKQINPNALKTYRSNILQIRNLCSNFNIRCYSIHQPTLVSRSANRNSQKIKQAIGISALNHSFDFDEHIKQFDKIYQINREVFEEDNIIDATFMNGNENLFFDHIHQNSNGTRELARIVCSKLKNEGF